MNFKSIFASILQGGAGGAVQSLSAQSGPISWQAVGIVAAFGALVSLSQALAPHPAVAAAKPAVAAAVSAI